MHVFLHHQLSQQDRFGHCESLPPSGDESDHLACGLLAVGHSVLQGLGVATGVVTQTTLESLAIRARGSLRDYNHSVMMQGLAQGGRVHS